MARIDSLKIPESLAVRIERLAADTSERPDDLAQRCLERGINEAETVRRELAELRALRERMPQMPISDDELRRFVDEGRA